MTEAKTIPEVLSSLDKIIAWAKQNQSRIGLFAALYRRMTVAVQDCISRQGFEDGKRMELLDVNFANRYIQAWNAYTNGQACTKSWDFAFDAAAMKGKVVLQHLILGINTHINLDLCIAAVMTCPGDKIYGLKNDFNTINDLIASLSQEIQDSLTKIWYPLKYLGRLTNNRQEAVLNFSITNARKASWANAQSLAFIEGNAHANYVDLVDKGVVEIARRILYPGFGATLILKPVVLMESKNVAELITLLEK